MAVFTGLLVLTLVISASAEGAKNVYSFTVKDIEGKDVRLEEYNSKVLLIVNVACLCGYTDTNYRELKWLQEHYGPKGFSVLAFPCNQFGSQEPWPESHIQEWVKENYDINFPMFSKVTVFGNDATPLYSYLSETLGKVPTWNFAKFIIDRNGIPVKFFSTKSKFEDVNSYLEAMLMERTEL